MERAIPGGQACTLTPSPARDTRPVTPIDTPRPRHHSPFGLLLGLLLPSLAVPIACAGTADGARSGETFARFLSRQPDRVFTGPPYSQRGQTVRHLHVSEQDFGQDEFRDPQVRYQSHLDGRDVEIRLAYDYVIVENQTFAYADARTFNGEIPAARHPVFADLHVAPRQGHRPTLLCIESHPGDADTTDTDGGELPLFLLIEPLSADARLYRLPGRFSSCAAVTATATETQPRFPAIRLLRDPDGHVAGARLDEYRIDGERFVETGNRVIATFMVPGDPSRVFFTAPAN